MMTTRPSDAVSIASKPRPATIGMRIVLKSRHRVNQSCRGTAGALGLNRLLASLLFGVEPTDPSTLVAVTSTIAIVAALACGLPAWRASWLDPNVVLRAG